MPVSPVLNQQKGAPNANEIAGRGNAKGENSVRVNRSVQSNGDEGMEMVGMTEIRYEQKQQVAAGGFCCCCIPCGFFKESSHEEPPKIFKFFMTKKKTPQPPPAAEVVQPRNSVPSPKALPVENYTLNATFRKEEARGYAKMTFKKSKSVQHRPNSRNSFRPPVSPAKLRCWVRLPHLQQQASEALSQWEAMSVRRKANTKWILPPIRLQRAAHTFKKEGPSHFNCER